MSKNNCVWNKNVCKKVSANNIFGLMSEDKWSLPQAFMSSLDLQKQQNLISRDEKKEYCVWDPSVCSMMIRSHFNLRNYEMKGKGKVCRGLRKVFSTIFILWASRNRGKSVTSRVVFTKYYSLWSVKVYSSSSLIW